MMKRLTIFAYSHPDTFAALAGLGILALGTIIMMITRHIIHLEKMADYGKGY